jgi:hypothetical protein
MSVRFFIRFIQTVYQENHIIRFLSYLLRCPECIYIRHPPGLRNDIGGHNQLHIELSLIIE